MRVCMSHVRLSQPCLVQPLLWASSVGRNFKQQLISSMLQSLRMVTACFLTEYLNISWVEGARWYHDTLVRCHCTKNL